MHSGGTRQRKAIRKSSDGQEEAKKNVLSETEAVEKASRRWVSLFLTALLITLLSAICFVIFIPSPIEPEHVELEEPPEWTGPLAANDHLAHADIIYKGKVVGPESIVVDGDHIYAGTADGFVTHIHKGQVKKLVRFGTGKCGSIEDENTCGRPLGMRMRKDGILVVLDAYFGLFEVNVVTGDFVTMFSSSMPIDGKKPAFLNDLDIGPDGKIYFSETSHKFGRNEFPKIFLEAAPTGRLLMYDPATNETKQLFEGFAFANGVQLTKDQSAVLVVDTVKVRILRYDLKTKQASVWADNLPGAPDNIRYNKNTGTYWVGFATVRERNKFSVFDFLASRPWLRSVLAKFATVEVFQFARKHFMQASPSAVAVEFDESGKIVRSLQSRSSDVLHGISEVESADGVLYFGSFHADFIGRLYTKRVPGY